MNFDKLLLRKTILASAVICLAVIYIFLCIFGSRSTMKDFVIEKAFDTIEITSSDAETIELKRYGDFWKMGMDDADTSKVTPLLDAVKSIKTLNLVSSSSSEADIERYGFSQAQKITVKVSDNGKEVLILEIGKDAANGQQNYIRLNGKNDIYLASNALRSKFSLKAADLKAKAKEEAAQEKAEDSTKEEESQKLL